MHWTIAAAFTRDPELDRWLAPSVPGNRHHFTLIPSRPIRSWHRRGRATGIPEWAAAWEQGTEAWRRSTGGIITVFPQLAYVVGFHQRLHHGCKPVVAWCFNTGELYQGAKRLFARTVLASVDRFVVHSRGEMSEYARWLNVPADRFAFVPLQRAEIAVVEPEDTQRPFVLAMGSARRDYATLFEAVREAGWRTVVVAARHAIEGLSLPENVELLGPMPRQECLRLAQRARVNVVPVLNDETASGQVTLLEAMRMGRAVVATRCMGSVDYVEDGVTGLLVEPRSAGDLRRAIARIWDDSSLRGHLGRNAMHFTSKSCSDEAAGEALGRVLDELADERRERLPG